MSLFSSKKSLTLKAAFLLLAISGVFYSTGSAARSAGVTTTNSCPTYSTYSTYYDDASMSGEEVGTLYVNCAGRSWKTGRITPYRTIDVIDYCINCLPQ